MEMREKEQAIERGNGEGMDGEEEGKVKSKEDRQTERHAGADLG